MLKFVLKTRTNVIIMTYEISYLCSTNNVQVLFLEKFDFEFLATGFVEHIHPYKGQFTVLEFANFSPIIKKLIAKL